MNVVTLVGKPRYERPSLVPIHTEKVTYAPEQRALDDSIGRMLTNHLGTTDAGGHATARPETEMGGSSVGAAPGS
jgi:hypothetical protein